MTITTQMTCDEILRLADPQTDLEKVLYEKLKLVVDDLANYGIVAEDIELALEGGF